MTELKISDSTQAIIDKYQSDIAAAETALTIAKKAANDILNVVLFESFINPNNVKNLQMKDEMITFDIIDHEPELTSEIDKIPNP